MFRVLQSLLMNRTGSFVTVIFGLLKKYVALFCLLSLCCCQIGCAAEESDTGKGSPAVDSMQLLVVLVFDQNCKVACVKVRPIMQELARKHEGRLKYSELDATPEAFDTTVKTAADLGVKTFLLDSTDLAPIVGIFNAKRKRIKELQGYKSKEVYEAAIDKALSSLK